MTKNQNQGAIPATQPVLYHFWRSSSSFRVRWALRLKGVAHQAVAVDLSRGEQHGEEHLLRNPIASVPVLRIGQTHIAQSTAIIEYLDEVYPDPPLLPPDPLGRARVRQLVQIINADTQPLQNLSVLQYWSTDSAQRSGAPFMDKEQQRTWAQHWIRRGLGAYEALARQTAGRFSYGDRVTMADLYLLPQCTNARRFGLEVDLWPTVARIEQSCLATTEAREAAPDQSR